MRVTVWRPKLFDGLGPPTACLGEDRPSQGDWHLSAKSEQPDGMDPRMMLHQMARDFLIRSMYHATEPYFIAVAVENYGAACKALGHCLPLTEEQATWPRYERSEVEPSTPEHYGRMFAAIAEVFGPKEAAEQASALGLSWPKRIPPRAPDSRRER